MSGVEMLIIVLTAFGFHVVMFGIEVILSIIIPILLYYYYTHKEELYLREARRLMNYIAVTYASAHFFLTATTVMLLSFFPEFLVMAGRILFYPLIFIVIFLILRLSMIGYFWYGWGKLSPKIHFITGIIFAIAGVIWVFLDMVLLAFMNSAQGLTSVTPLEVDALKLFTNPSLIPLLLTVVFGASAVTTFLLVFVYIRRTFNDRHVFFNSLLVRVFYNVGVASTILFTFSLVWYLLVLKNICPHKFNNMVGGLGSNAEFNLGWMLLTIIGLLVIFIVSISWNWWKLEIRKEDTISIIVNNKIQLMAYGPISAIIFVLVILLNFMSQAPYFVISKFQDQLPMFEVKTAVNEYADIIGVYAYAIFGFVPLLNAFFVLLYFVFTGRIGGDYTPTGRIASKL